MKEIRETCYMSSGKQEDTETNFRSAEDSRSYFTELLRFEETMDNCVLSPDKIHRQDSSETDNIDMKLEYGGLVSEGEDERIRRELSNGSLLSDMLADVEHFTIEQKLSLSQRNSGQEDSYSASPR